MKTHHSKKLIIPFLIVGLALVLSITALWYQHRSAAEGRKALIYQDGAVVQEVPLTGIDEPYTFTVEYPGGGYNTIRVEEGRIGVVDTDCPDKICQDMGMISSTLYPISCLPHRLVIQIEGEESEALDSISR